MKAVHHCSRAGLFACRPPGASPSERDGKERARIDNGTQSAKRPKGAGQARSSRMHLPCLAYSMLLLLICSPHLVQARKRLIDHAASIDEGAGDLRPGSDRWDRFALTSAVAGASTQMKVDLQTYTDSGNYPLGEFTAGMCIEYKFKSEQQYADWAVGEASHSADDLWTPVPIGSLSCPAEVTCTRLGASGFKMVVNAGVTTNRLTGNVGPLQNPPSAVGVVLESVTLYANSDCSGIVSQAFGPTAAITPAPISGQTLALER